jgi:hypothetical protein
MAPLQCLAGTGRVRFPQAGPNGQAGKQGKSQTAFRFHGSRFLLLALGGMIHKQPGFSSPLCPRSGMKQPYKMRWQDAMILYKVARPGGALKKMLFSKRKIWPKR